jgi:hypothetical protein
MNSEILIAFGFGWMVVAALIGLYLGAKHERQTDRLRSAAASGNLPEYHRVFEAYKWHSSVHAHGMLFALSSVGVGLALSRAGGALPFAEALVGTLILATVLWTVAALRRIRPLMGLADLMFIGVLAVIAANVARAS